MTADNTSATAVHDTMLRDLCSVEEDGDSQDSSTVSSSRIGLNEYVGDEGSHALVWGALYGTFSLPRQEHLRKKDMSSFSGEEKKTEEDQQLGPLDKPSTNNLTPKRPSHSHAAKFSTFLWNRQWEEARDYLKRDPTLAQHQVELPCFGGSPCLGLPLHLACAMRPLPPFDLVEALVNQYPVAVKAPEKTWGMLPLHFLSDLRMKPSDVSHMVQSIYQRHEHLIKKQNQSHSKQAQKVTGSSTDVMYDTLMGNGKRTDPPSLAFESSKDDDSSEECSLSLRKRASSSLSSATSASTACESEDDGSTKSFHLDSASSHIKLVYRLLQIYPRALEIPERFNGMLPIHIAASSTPSFYGLIPFDSFFILSLFLGEAPASAYVRDNSGESLASIAKRQARFSPGFSVHDTVLLVDVTTAKQNQSNGLSSSKVLVSPLPNWDWNPLLHLEGDSSSIGSSECSGASHDVTDCPKRIETTPISDDDVASSVSSNDVVSPQWTPPAMASLFVGNLDDFLGSSSSSEDTSEEDDGLEHELQELEQHERALQAELNNAIVDVEYSHRKTVKENQQEFNDVATRTRHACKQDALKEAPTAADNDEEENEEQGNSLQYSVNIWKELRAGGEPTIESPIDEHRDGNQCRSKEMQDSAPDLALQRAVNESGRGGHQENSVAVDLSEVERNLRQELESAKSDATFLCYSFDEDTYPSPTTERILTEISLPLTPTDQSPSPEDSIAAAGLGDSPSLILLNGLGVVEDKEPPSSAVGNSSVQVPCKTSAPVEAEPVLSELADQPPDGQHNDDAQAPVKYDEQGQPTGRYEAINAEGLAKKPTNDEWKEGALIDQKAFMSSPKVESLPNRVNFVFDSNQLLRDYTTAAMDPLSSVDEEMGSRSEMSSSSYSTPSLVKISKPWPDCLVLKRANPVTNGEHIETDGNSLYTAGKEETQNIDEAESITVINEETHNDSSLSDKPVENKDNAYNDVATMTCRPAAHEDKAKSDHAIIQESSTTESSVEEQVEACEERIQTLLSRLHGIDDQEDGKQHMSSETIKAKREAPCCARNSHKKTHRRDESTKLDRDNQTGLSFVKENGEIRPACGVSELSSQLQELTAINQAQRQEIDRLRQQLTIMREIKGVAVEDLCKALETVCLNHMASIGNVQTTSLESMENMSNAQANNPDAVTMESKAHTPEKELVDSSYEPVLIDPTLSSNLVHDWCEELLIEDGAASVKAKGFLIEREIDRTRTGSGSVTTGQAIRSSAGKQLREESAITRCAASSQSGGFEKSSKECSGTCRDDSEGSESRTNISAGASFEQIKTNLLDEGDALNDLFLELLDEESLRRIEAPSMLDTPPKTITFERRKSKQSAVEKKLAMFDECDSCSSDEDASEGSPSQSRTEDDASLASEPTELDMENSVLVPNGELCALERAFDDVFEKATTCLFKDCSPPNCQRYSEPGRKRSSMELQEQPSLDSLQDLLLIESAADELLSDTRTHDTHIDDSFSGEEQPDPAKLVAGGHLIFDGKQTQNVKKQTIQSTAADPIKVGKYKKMLVIEDSMTRTPPGLWLALAETDNALAKVQTLADIPNPCERLAETRKARYRLITCAKQVALQRSTLDITQSQLDEIDELLADLQTTIVGLTSHITARTHRTSGKDSVEVTLFGVLDDEMSKASRNTNASTQVHTGMKVPDQEDPKCACLGRWNLSRPTVAED